MSRCAFEVWDAWNPRPCRRRGTVEEDGQHWCKQHAPSAVRKRRDEASERYKQAQQRRCPNCGHTGPRWEFTLP